MQSDASSLIFLGAILVIVLTSFVIFKDLIKQLNKEKSKNIIYGNNIIQKGSPHANAENYQSGGGNIEVKQESDKDTIIRMLSEEVIIKNKMIQVLDKELCALKKENEMLEKKIPKENYNLFD